MSTAPRPEPTPIYDAVVADLGIDPVPLGVPRPYDFRVMDLNATMAILFRQGVSR